MDRIKSVFLSSVQPPSRAQVFWCGVVLSLLILPVGPISGPAVCFALAAILLAFGFFAARTVYSAAAIVFVGLCVLSAMDARKHEAEQQRWLREHPDSFLAKSPAEKQQWLREHDPALAKSHTHP